MENKQTAVEQLIDCIPSATEIMDYMHNYQPDEKMLDNWLWERIYKDRDWVKLEKEQMIEFADRYGFDVCHFDYDRADEYYERTYKQQDNG